MLFNLLSDFVNTVIVLLSMLYLFSSLFMITHEVIIRLYIKRKLDPRYVFNIDWRICLRPILNTIATYASLDYIYVCICNNEDYIKNTATQFYENDL